MITELQSHKNTRRGLLRGTSKVVVQTNVEGKVLQISMKLN